MELATIEFVLRWCLHIQPDQLTKTRYYGGWCCRKRKKYQATCRRLLGLGQEVAELPQIELLSSADDVLDGESLGSESGLKNCPACKSCKLSLIAQTARPSWASLLTHSDPRCPTWYAQTEHSEFCEYLEREYGISYDDWCLEMRIESTMSEPSQPEPARPARQLYLPGLCPENGYLLESH